jgi:hypothetical protein
MGRRMATFKIIVVLLVLSVSVIGCDPVTTIIIINDTPYSITVKADKIEKTISSQETFRLSFLAQFSKDTAPEDISRELEDYCENGIDIWYLEEHYHLTLNSLVALIANVAKFRKNVMAYIFKINISDVLNELRKAKATQ